MEEVGEDTRKHVADASVQTEGEVPGKWFLAGGRAAEGEPKENLIRRGVFSSMYRRWQCQTWWICEDAREDAFRVDAPEAWPIFRDPNSGRPYWWHERTRAWFWTGHVAETQ